MATSRLKLYNGALLLCGATTLHPSTGLSENREERRQLDAAWDNDAVRSCLQAAQWNFAIRTKEIPYTSDVEPSFGYPRAYLKPDDFVRTVAVCSDENFDTPLLRYFDESDYWFADLDQIYVRYVSDDNAYGLDMAKWPYSFTRFVEAYLADQVCLKVTGGDEKRILKVERELEKRLRRARTLDAIEDPTLLLPQNGSWTSARRGWGGPAGRNSGSGGGIGGSDFDEIVVG